MRRSSGPPIFGTSITPLARRRGGRDVCAQSTDVAVPLNEEAVEQTDEERDDDQQHERWQVAQDEDQHQRALDTTGRLEAARPLGRPQAVALVAKERQRAAAE